MPDSKTYTGGCHCGQVRFECTSDLAMVTACNCSICTKKGLHFTFLDPKSFQLRAGDENLKEYLFNKHAIHHQICIDCGVDVFARGKKPDGSDVIALNVSCIDGIELSKLTMTPMDGQEHVTLTLLVLPGLTRASTTCFACSSQRRGWRVKPRHDGERVRLYVTRPTPCTAGKSRPR